MTKAEIIAHNLKQLRAQNNWSQAQTADAAFTTERTIRRYESGTHESFADPVLERIARAFGVDKNQLESNPDLIVTVDPSSITDSGATLQFKKPKEKKPPSHADAIRSAMRLLAESAPQNEDELLLLESFRQLDEMRQAWILFLVSGSEERFQKWRALYQGDLGPQHQDSMAIMNLADRQLPPKR